MPIGSIKKVFWAVIFSLTVGALIYNVTAIAILFAEFPVTVSIKLLHEKEQAVSAVQSSLKDAIAKAKEQQKVINDQGKKVIQSRGNLDKAAEQNRQLQNRISEQEQTIREQTALIGAEKKKYKSLTLSVKQREAELIELAKEIDARAAILDEQNEMIAELDAILSFQSETIDRQKYLLYLSGTIVLLLFLFAIVLFRNYQAKRRTNVQLQEAADELKRAKKMAEAANRTKSTFLANMSHELRTPLNTVLGFSDLLARDPEATLDQREKLEIINRSGDHLLAMINDVLDLSKIEAGQVDLEMEAFDLSQLLQQIGDMFEMRAESVDLRFNLELSPNLAPYIKADSRKLRQVLINLLGNATKFTQEGGFSLRANTVPIADDPDMVTLQIEVEDSGPGIPPEQLKRIFEPFVQVGHPTTAVKGTGLGLAITKSYLELMGDDIRVKSEVGKGTLFQIEFTVALAETDEAKSSSATLPEVAGLAPGQPEWRILVVEDNPENRLLLVSLLKHAGFKVQEVENGKEAISQFKQWHPHFIWMDMRMPVLDGYEATAQIRKLPGGDQVKVVAITANVFKEQRKSVLNAGCDEVLHKPFQAHEIFDTMAKQLGVSYNYAEETKTKPVVPAKITCEQLSNLPANLLNELRDALEIGHKNGILICLEKIESHNPDIVPSLRAMAKNYDYLGLSELLKPKGKAS